MSDSGTVGADPQAPHRRVLRIITRLNVGGPARQALLLHRGLADGYDTTLAAGRPPPAEGELTDPTIPVTRVPLVRRPSPGADLRALAAVRQLLSQLRPDIVHTHMAKAGTIGRLATIGMFQRPRSVHTFHGHVLEGYFGPVAQRTVIEAERVLAHRADALVAVSPEIRDELLALHIGRPSQYRVIPLGLDLAELLVVEGQDGALRARIGLSAATCLIGVIGRLVPIKDHETLLAALPLVPDAHLAIIGDGELRSHLESRVRDLDLGSRVHFIGWWTDIASAMADVDVVVLTSRNEGTPVSLIEAAAAGRPTVATDVGGVRSVVLDGVTGYLVPPRAPDAVASRLTQLLENPGLREQMGQAGRDHVRERFGEERLVGDIRMLYDDLLGEPR